MIISGGPGPHPNYKPSNTQATWSLHKDLQGLLESIVSALVDYIEDTNQ